MIYFVGTKTRCVKIGFTDCIRHRLGELQVGNHEKLHLIAWIDGDRELEAEMHERFRAYQIRGEWFRLEGGLREFVKQLYFQRINSKPVKLTAIEREHLEVTRVLESNDEQAMRAAAITGRRRKLSNERQAATAARRLDAISAQRNLRPPGKAYGDSAGGFPGGKDGRRAVDRSNAREMRGRGT